jgi:hypothetical protein
MHQIFTICKCKNKCSHPTLESNNIPWYCWSITPSPWPKSSLIYLHESTLCGTIAGVIDDSHFSKNIHHLILCVNIRRSQLEARLTVFYQIGIILSMVEDSRELQLDHKQNNCFHSMVIVLVFHVEANKKKNLKKNWKCFASWVMAVFQNCFNQNQEKLWMASR